MLYDALNATNAMAIKADADEIVILTAYRVLAQLQPKYNAAKLARERREERDRKVVPIEEFHLNRVLIQRVATIYEALPELSSRLNPQDPALARSTIEDWFTRSVQPAIQTVIEDCEARARPALHDPGDPPSALAA
jgi:hypothetical protein